ncbi:hypothetical protein CC80DRAFT_491966 [Byssothecium circinans]|uniref:Uncharacterized protein n=1 Tax=Byssothecium circinans TaxID=147558 RepID=A0A6A5TXJ1_9PLEO|nr:hypothetical protein CC80DRAFT_491966 [Byssothecium circinans]
MGKAGCGRRRWQLDGPGLIKKGRKEKKRRQKLARRELRLRARSNAPPGRKGFSDDGAGLALALALALAGSRGLRKRTRGERNAG